MSVAVPFINKLVSTRDSALLDAVREAARRVAPSWPLDQLIAVNPWWELRDLPIDVAAARLAALRGVKLVMDKSCYADLWQKEILPNHLEKAAAELGVEASVEQLLAHLKQSRPERHWRTISEIADDIQSRHRVFAWQDEITQQISQFCAAVFQQDGPLAHDRIRTDGLYRAWHEAIEKDRGIEILMGQSGLAQQFRKLPGTCLDLISAATEELGIDNATLSDCAHALLLDINGWSSWMAYLRWQERLHGGEYHGVEELVAIRLAWELVVWRHHRERGDERLFLELERAWRDQIQHLPGLLNSYCAANRLTWVWQRGREIAYQEQLQRELRHRPGHEKPGRPLLQAVFCIDVRSEMLRRALERQHQSIVTLGFAGFFGLPLEYHPAGTDFARPQLPGLLAPSMRVSGVTESSGTTNARRQRLNRAASWKDLFNAPPAMFSLVEALGLLQAWRLVRDTFAPKRYDHPVNAIDSRERLEFSVNGNKPDAHELAELCKRTLRAMGLVDNFAPVVMLIGHGSRSTNNPQAAALDCGACGGQSGEINARALAQILNDPAVRNALFNKGVAIPEQTRFVPALHDTTTDEIEILSHEPLDADMRGWLASASAEARRERAPRLGIAATDDRKLLTELRRRSNDWSEVRPEWGLAGNAAFIVAPRSWTRERNLEGRAFLHDYAWQEDTGFKVLELIMTAPMLVTNWINLQYYASVTDNLKYGSGNKVLHNVVGGNIGVFEGNGGDLRIGLALQSLHDGKQWIHPALRLSVYIAAPKRAIEAIVARHESVRNLIDNGWLFLFRLDDEAQSPERLYRGVWRICT
jgi:uncharacterized protein YbcC (UPF0753/DUF2309 family)